MRRRDNLTAAMHMLVEALFWFHQLVWWIGARLVATREQACDEHVVDVDLVVEVLWLRGLAAADTDRPLRRGPHDRHSATTSINVARTEFSAGTAGHLTRCGFCGR